MRRAMLRHCQSVLELYSVMVPHCPPAATRRNGGCQCWPHQPHYSTLQLRAVSSSSFVFVVTADHTWQCLQVGHTPEFLGHSWVSSQQCSPTLHTLGLSCIHVTIVDSRGVQLTPRPSVPRGPNDSSAVAYGTSRNTTGHVGAQCQLRGIQGREQPLVQAACSNPSEDMVLPAKKCCKARVPHFHQCRLPRSDHSTNTNRTYETSPAHCYR
jgi:hypothetical protein